MDFSNVQSKCGSKGNVKHVPGGGNVSNYRMNSTPCLGSSWSYDHLWKPCKNNLIQFSRSVCYTVTFRLIMNWKRGSLLRLSWLLKTTRQSKGRGRQSHYSKVMFYLYHSQTHGSSSLAVLSTSKIISSITPALPQISHFPGKNTGSEVGL